MSENGNPHRSAQSRRRREVAVLADCCCRRVEEILRDVAGVIDTEVGYAGGWLENPTYHDTDESKSGHAEAVRTTFDPAVISYEDFLEKWFFKLHDPTTLNRQGRTTCAAPRKLYLSLDARVAGLATASRLPSRRSFRACAASPRAFRGQFGRRQAAARRPRECAAPPLR